MPISMEKVTHRRRFNFPSLMSADLKRECLNEIGGYLVSTILDSCAGQVSPVNNRPFKRLSDDYAKYKASTGADPVPNLELLGDMLSSLEYRIEGDSLEIGIFDSDQAPKAYNHNLGDTLPKRQFIPDDDEQFAPSIREEIDAIYNSYIDQFLEGERGALEQIKVKTPTITRATTPQTIDVGELLDFGEFL